MVEAVKGSDRIFSRPGVSYDDKLSSPLRPLSICLYMDFLPQ